MLNEIDDWTWNEVFAFAGKDDGSNSGQPERALPNDTDTSVEPFGREDVESIIAMDDGENDEQDWLVTGKLKDGRFFFINAGCDYTGWD